MWAGLNLVVPERNLGLGPLSDGAEVDASHYGDSLRREWTAQELFVAWEGLCGNSELAEKS